MTARRFLGAVRAAEAKRMAALVAEAAEAARVKAEAEEFFRSAGLMPAAGRDGESGQPGAPGQNGRDGRDGAPGAPGPPGRDGTYVVSSVLTYEEFDGGFGFRPIKSVDQRLSDGSIRTLTVRRDQLGRPFAVD